MFARLAKKIAQKYMNEQQPLRLQPDYGERNAADFLGDRNVARNTGYGEKRWFIHKETDEPNRYKTKECNIESTYVVRELLKQRNMKEEDSYERE